VDLGTIANVATALTVLVGVAFGLVEMRRARRDREERAAFAAVQAFMTPEWMSSPMIVHSIPKGTTAEQLQNDPRMLEACLKIATIMEGIGYSVYARIVPLSVAADLIGGTARIAWQNFRPFAELERTRAGTQKSWEWFQMAGGTTRTPQCDQDEFGDGCTNRLPRLAAVICVSSANRRTSLDGF
jgi:hypothetical protein